MTARRPDVRNSFVAQKGVPQFRQRRLFGELSAPTVGLVPRPLHLQRRHARSPARRGAPPTKNARRPSHHEARRPAPERTAAEPSAPATPRPSWSLRCSSEVRAAVSWNTTLFIAAAAVSVLRRLHANGNISAGRRPGRQRAQRSPSVCGPAGGMLTSSLLAVCDGTNPAV